MAHASRMHSNLSTSTVLLRQSPRVSLGLKNPTEKAKFLLNHHQRPFARRPGIRRAADDYDANAYRFSQASAGAAAPSGRPAEAECRRAAAAGLGILGREQG